MKRINVTFYRPKEINTLEFENIIGKLELDFNYICEASVDEYSVYNYIGALLNKAETLEQCPGMFFLGLENPRNMPGDCRVLYFYRPTYLAAAIIIKSILLHPEIMEDGNGFSLEDCKETVKNIFPGLLLGCTGRGFSGHGYDDLKGLIETLSIFVKADTEKFLEKYPDLCSEFTELYRSSMQMIKDRLLEGTLKNGWGTDYSEKAREMLQMLQKDS